eukprot:m.472059 g.472059  ORF g.472059 m.472059 type:complete len:563 (+) comp32081_c0_seq1:43-1731(+)
MADETFDGFNEKVECGFPASSGKGVCKQPPDGSNPYCRRHTCEKSGCTAGKGSKEKFCPTHSDATGGAEAASPPPPPARDPAPVAPPVGSRCKTEFGNGTVRFLGTVTNPSGYAAYRVGVELDERKGKTNGSLGTKTYFTCAAKHGVFLHPNDVTAIEDDGSARANPVTNALLGLVGLGDDEEEDGDQESGKRKSSTFAPEQEPQLAPGVFFEAQESDTITPIIKAGEDDETEAIYASYDADALISLRRTALQEHLYDTCPTYAEAVATKDADTSGMNEVKYEGEVEDATVPRASVEGEYVPPERDVVNCVEGFKRSPNSKTAVFTLGTLASLIAFLVVGGVGPIVALAIFGLLYFIEAFGSKTFKYLLNQMTRTQTMEWYEKMTGRHPWVSWYIENYHYETRTRTYTDSNGNTQTETYTVTVTTHTASELHQINSWVDCSFPLGDVRHKMTKLKMKKHFMWVDEYAESMHNRDFREWERYHTRDVHHFVTWNWGISGWKSSIFEVEDGATAPCWIRYGFILYLSCILTLLAWPYRIFLASVVTKRKEHIRKMCGWVNQSWS